jgi:hypothetical protein
MQAGIFKLLKRTGAVLDAATAKITICAISLAIASEIAFRCCTADEPFPNGLPVKETRLHVFLILR